MACPLTFPEFETRLLRLYQPPLRARASYFAMRTALQDFAKVPGVASTVDITTDSVAQFIASRRSENVNTTLSKLRALKTASLYACEEGWLDRPPQWRRLFPRGVASARRTHLTHDQVVRILAAMEAEATDWKGRRLFTITSAIAYTGLRRNECLYLWRTDIDLENGVIFVDPRRRQKTVASAAPVPIPDGLRPILERWLSEPARAGEWLFPGVRGLGPWSGGAPGYRPLDLLKRAAERAGVEGVTFHGLRHTLAKLYVSRWGGTADQARSILRHTDAATTERYLHRDDVEELRRIGSRIQFDRP